MNIHQEAVRPELWIDGVEHRFFVTVLRGRESLSQCYSFEVGALTSRVVSSGAESLVGRRASLVFRQGARVRRRVRGVIAFQQVEGFPAWDGRRLVRLRLVPRLWLLRRRRDTRIFQNQSVVEIVTAVLRDRRVRHRWALDGQYPALAYCVQYQETDYEFVARLLAEHGIFYYFEAPEDALDHGAPAGAGVSTAANLVGATLGASDASDDAPGEAAGLEETVVLADTARHYPPLGGLDEVAGASEPAPAPPLYFARVLDATRGHRGAVVTFALRNTARTTAVMVRGFEMLNPALRPTERADTTGIDDAATPPGVVAEDLEHFEHHDEYDRVTNRRRRARLLLAREQARVLVGHARTDYSQVTPGYRFALRDHPIDEFNDEYAVVGAVHEGRMADEAAADPSAGFLYHNDLECVRADVAVHPRPRRRRLQQVSETATVVGPRDEEIYTDEHGRIKVQFHWDRHGRDDERSSCWIRVAQSWAGTHWGAQFLPRVGMEVLVTFYDGDTDRPLVVGVLYNGSHAPPFALPEHKSRSGWRTSSTPGGFGGNELSFEDAAGAEQVYILAERDLDVVVKHDHHREVRHDERITVAGDRDEAVHGHRAARVDGNEHTHVEGAQTIRVRGPQETRTEASRTDRADGGLAVLAQRYRTAEVHGTDSRLVVDGDARDVVAHDHTTLVVGRSLYSVRGGAEVHVGGEYALRVVHGALLDAREDLALDAGQRLRLRAADGIVLTCGESTIELTKDGITLKGKKVLVRGSDEATVRGSSAALRLDGDATLSGSNVVAHSSSASLELGSDAKLQGSKVKFGSGGGASSSSQDSSSSAQPARREWVVRVLQPTRGDQRDRRPLANASFVARGHGPEPYEGSTDGDGVARVPVVWPRCQIDLAFEGFTVRLTGGGLADAATEVGGRQRLFNLGFGPPDPESWDDQTHRRVLEQFQQKHGLTVSGRICDATRAQIQSLHPS